MINIIKNYEIKRDNKNIKNKLNVVIKCLKVKEKDTLDEQFILQSLTQNLTELIDSLKN